MNLKKIPSTDFKKMKWKNGLGHTYEIAIDPPEAQLALENFSWRLSVAQIQGASPFSIFKGYQRWLVVWKGEGLLLNKKPLLPLQPLQFQGSSPIDCELLGDVVYDLGLIYNPQRFKAIMTVHSSWPVTSEAFSNLVLMGNKTQSTIHFIFCAKGQVTLNGMTLYEMDCCQITKVAEKEILEIQSILQGTQIIIISLQPLISITP